MGFVEGWGEYASQLCWDMGVYESPYDKAGRIMQDLMVSVRLVVDTGMNAMGWSRERAMQYMRENLTLNESQIETESLRYSTDIPGQALAYKTGELTMLRLREHAREQLGDAFDIRKFHSWVIDSGSMTLDTLEQHVNYEIARQKNGNGGTCGSRRGLLVYANAGLFCDGYILSSIGIALVAMPSSFHCATSSGLIGAATLLGILIGAPLFGRYTDRIGRRVLLIFDLCFFVAACVAQAFVTIVAELVALRFVLGVAIGADYPIAAALIGESVSQRARGAALNSMQVAWFLGAAVAYVAGYALLRHAGAESWRWILASPALFAAIGLALRASAPESPLWLESRERGEIARTPWAAIFSREHRGALAFVSAMWLLQVVPLFAIYAFAPALLGALGLRSENSPAGSVAIVGAFLIGSLLSLPLVERWGRRPLCIAGFAAGTIAFALSRTPARRWW